MNSITNPIAIAALQAPADPAIEDEPGMCSRAIRQVCQKAHGPELHALFGANARESCDLWEEAGLIVSEDIDDVQHGDIVFKRDAGKYGHVGAYVGGGLIFDNSTYKGGRVVGGKGFRTVAQFGGPVKIGRYKPEAR